MKWRVNLQAPQTASTSKLDPPGYNQQIGALVSKEPSQGGKQTVAVDFLLKEKKAWEFAQSSLKQVGMYAFMMYMSGNSVHIFSIMMTFTGLYQPLVAIFNSGESFKPFQDQEGRVNTLGPRALFCLIQLGSLGFALYKLANVGLLPTHVSDWVGGLPPIQPIEYSSGT